MTDTFANGPGAPGGSDPNAAPQAGDLTGTLAELERKLRELESELSSIGRRGESAEVPAPSSPPATPSAGRLVDEAIEPPAPSVPRPAASGQPMKFMRPNRRQPPPARAQPPAAEPPAAEPPAAEPPAAEPPAAERPAAERPAAEPPAARSAAEPPERPRPTEAQLASLAELRRFRDRLERFARDLTAEYDALLGRVMSGLTSAAPQADSPAPAPGPEDVLFEGRVELGVGPFYDMAALTAFERQLAALAFVADASVRRFEASHAVVDVRLATPVALVRELRRALDSEFGVREIADGRVLLTFDEV